MSTKEEKAPHSAQQQHECLHFREFKSFLSAFLAGHESANTTNERSCVTRNNNETYPVNEAELQAEILMSIWNWLQSKQCPRLFQMSILRAALAECCNTKDFATSAQCTGESINELQYDLVKLQKFVANNLEKFFTRLNDNAAVEYLRNYADDDMICAANGVTENCQCESATAANKKPKRYVASAIKNKPRKMEDRHICLERFGEMYDLKRSYSFYGIFDGHSGPLAASYVTCQLPYLLAKHLKDSPLKSPDDCREAFEAAFLQADKQFTQKHISSGTTAVCALLANEASSSHLYVAWVGDSRALLVGRDASLQLVKSHKPDSPEERKRIEDAGGSVMFVQGQWRVNGFLNVARSIGDYAVGNAVIAEPDFVDIPLTSAHDFLVLGTDGLWDHVEEAAVVTTIYDALAEETQDVTEIPKLLIELAKEGDSQDNITVVIVFLKERIEIVGGQCARETELNE